MKRFSIIFYLFVFSNCTGHQNRFELITSAAVKSRNFIPAVEKSVLGQNNDIVILVSKNNCGKCINKVKEVFTQLPNAIVISDFKSTKRRHVYYHNYKGFKNFEKGLFEKSQSIQFPEIFLNKNGGKFMHIIVDDYFDVNTFIRTVKSSSATFE